MSVNDEGVLVRSWVRPSTALVSVLRGANLESAFVEQSRLK